MIKDKKRILIKQNQYLLGDFLKNTAKGADVGGLAGGITQVAAGDTAGGIFNTVGSIAEGIPVFGGLIGGALKGIGGIFSMGAQRRKELKEFAAKSAIKQQEAINEATNFNNSVGNKIYPDSLGTNIYSGGGIIKTVNPNDDLIKINTGGTHEENPIGGVPVGSDENGTMNTVEQGETIMKDFVYSNRIYLPEDINLKSEYGLPNSLKGKSFAKASEIINNKFKDREDKTSLETKKIFLDRLANLQEQLKQEEQQANNANTSDLRDDNQGAIESIQDNEIMSQNENMGPQKQFEKGGYKNKDENTVDALRVKKSYRTKELDDQFEKNIDYYIESILNNKLPTKALGDQYNNKYYYYPDFESVKRGISLIDDNFVPDNNVLSEILNSTFNPFYDNTDYVDYYNAIDFLNNPRTYISNTLGDEPELYGLEEAGVKNSKKVLKNIDKVKRLIKSTIGKGNVSNQKNITSTALSDLRSRYLPSNTSKTVQRKPNELPSARVSNRTNDSQVIDIPYKEVPLTGLNAGNVRLALPGKNNNYESLKGIKYLAAPLGIGASIYGLSLLGDKNPSSNMTSQNDNTNNDINTSVNNNPKNNIVQNSTKNNNNNNILDNKKSIRDKVKTLGPSFNNISSLNTDIPLDLQETRLSDKYKKEYDSIKEESINKDDNLRKLENKLDRSAAGLAIANNLTRLWLNKNPSYAEYSNIMLPQFGTLYPRLTNKARLFNAIDRSARSAEYSLRNLFGNNPGALLSNLGSLYARQLNSKADTALQVEDRDNQIKMGIDQYNNQMTQRNALQNQQSILTSRALYNQAKRDYEDTKSHLIGTLFDNLVEINRDKKNKLFTERLAPMYNNYSMLAGMMPQSKNRKGGKIKRK